MPCIVLSCFRLIIILTIWPACTFGQANLDSLLPVRALSIAAPTPSILDSFINFIHQELAPRKVNTLILRVDHNYQYKTRPELADSDALSPTEVKKIVDACEKHQIRIIPQINLLGHQSWAGTTGLLLQKYPQFDETPHVKMPANYEWPNADGLYCKSYCPRHPDVHDVVFDIVDEVCDAFNATAFHAGMDEVFYIGDDKCPRCSGRDKAELFADEVRKIRDHLAKKKRKLWIWGDRLLDGKTTGLGMWEASYNNTHRAIDMIPKDVVICDWHYERPDKTAVFFAMKGLQVITCSWRKPEVAAGQVHDMVSFRKQSTSQMKENFYGVAETVWSPAQSFLREFYQNSTGNKPAQSNTPSNCFRTMYETIEKLALPK